MLEFMPICLNRLPPALLALCLAVAAAQPATAASQGCLSPRETREIVARKAVMQPAAALRVARSSAGGGQALQARLCHGEAGLVYHFAILRPDGKVVRLTLDAVTGKVARRQEGLSPRRLDRAAPAQNPAQESAGQNHKGHF
jgi:hypothetical protein